MRSDIIFHRYLGRARCAVAAIAALSLAERYFLTTDRVSGNRTFPTWEDVLQFGMRSGIKNRSGRPIHVFRYLLRPDLLKKGGPVQLKSGDKGPLKYISSLVALIAKSYFDPTRPMGALLQNPTSISQNEQNTLKDLASICDNSWYEKAIDRLETDDSATAQKKIDDIEFQKFLDILGSASKDLAHPDFPSLPLVCDLTVACEFHGLAPERKPSRGRSGLFAIIREARGWTVEQDHEKDRNLIVRDLFWVQNLDDIVAGGREVTGIYYSVYDSKTFEVHAVGDVEAQYRQTKNVIATARLPGEREYAFQLCFPMHQSTQPISVRHGLIAGTARTEHQLAAWKVLLIEPRWTQVSRLETLIYLLTEREEIKRISDILIKGKYCGVLHRQGSRAETRRNSFRKLVFNNNNTFSIDHSLGGSLKLEIVDAITTKLEEYIDDPQSTYFGAADELIPKYADSLLSEFNKILQRRWYLVEPTQIITFIPDKLGDLDGERAGMVEDLLSRLDIEPR